MPVGAGITTTLAALFATSIFSVVDFVLLLKTGHVSPHSQQLLATNIPKYPIFIFDAFSTTTLILSATAHTCSCMPRPISSTLWRLDQAGIGLGIFGCFIPGTFYAFHCYPPGTGFKYLLITCFMVVTCACVNVSLSKWVSTRFLRVLRVASYCLLCSTAVAPIVEIVTNEASGCALRQAMAGIVAAGALAAIGGVFYGSGFPERSFPGKFDYVGSSHQIFHVFVVATFVAYHALYVLLWQWRSSAGSCGNPDVAQLCLRQMQQRIELDAPEAD